MRKLDNLTFCKVIEIDEQMGRPIGRPICEEISPFVSYHTYDLFSIDKISWEIGSKCTKYLVSINKVSCKIGSKHFEPILQQMLSYSTK